MRDEVMSELMNTREAAAYLGINEKKVYFLAKAGRIPCTRVTGKWTFPRRLIDRWIEESAAGVVGRKAKTEERNFFSPQAAMIRAWGYCTISTRAKPKPRHFS